MSPANCDLIAMAVAANISLAEATEAYQKACQDVRGKRMTGSWKGRTHKIIRERALEELGLSLHKIKTERMMLKKLGEHLEEGELYLCTTTNHVQAIKKIDGIVYVVDKMGYVNMEECCGKNEHVRDVLAINKKCEA